MIKIVKENNGRVTYSCFKGGLSVIGEVIGIIHCDARQCPECIIEQNLPVNCSNSTEYNGIYPGTAQGGTGTIAAAGNVFTAKKVKL